MPKSQATKTMIPSFLATELSPWYGALSPLPIFLVLLLTCLFFLLPSDSQIQQKLDAIDSMEKLPLKTSEPSGLLMSLLTAILTSNHRRGSSTGTNSPHSISKGTSVSSFFAC